jgi:hypothetical protein
MEQGPAKLRRRTTSGVRMLAFEMLLSRAQTETLDSFYQDDLASGSLPFDFTHPRDGSAISCRFKRPPEYVPTSSEYFRCGLELEILP